ncbi:MAG: hypothetical protein ACD_73C00040G0001, partial [uncultured bacterium]
MREVVIVSAARTPVGSFMGSLAGLSAPQLGSVAIKEAVKRAGINPGEIQEVILGNVLTSGEGQSPTRQAILGAGLPKEVGALTIGKVCGSGLKSVMLADQIIRSGDADVIIAGGMESMSNAPYILPKARSGYRMGHDKIVDSMILDGLWDPYNNVHMGTCAEKCAKEYKITREMQDAFSAESYKRAQNAVKEGVFKDE